MKLLKIFSIVIACLIINVGLSSCMNTEADKKVQKLEESNECSINASLQGVAFTDTYDVSSYGQVIDNDFYFLRNHENRRYTIYKNEENYIDFEYPNECVVDSMAYYESYFYFVVNDLMDENYYLYKISRDDLKLVKCFKLKDMTFEDLICVYIYDKKFWSCINNNLCSFDLETGKSVDKIPMSKNMKKMSRFKKLTFLEDFIM